ncbi:hypothetical protein Btru_059753 [Bulinus truncatus]|nr:hypothetical protein Btru_059753 [Bulinus truncatus]
MVNTLDSTVGVTVQIYLSSDDVLDLPETLLATFQFKDNTTMKLHLQRSPDLSLDIPIYTVDEDGETIKNMQTKDIDQDKVVGFYQDVLNHANIKLSRESDGRLIIASIDNEGYFIEGGQAYTISPSNKVEGETGPHQQMYNIEQADEEIHRPGARDFIKATEEMLSVNFDPDPPLLRHTARHARDVKPTYYIDVAAAVDNHLYQLFVSKSHDVYSANQDIVEYFSFVFNGIDLCYKGITWAPYNINVRLIKVVYFSDVNTFNATPVAGVPGVVDADKTLDSLGIFLRSPLGKTMFVPYDHVMLFAGLPMNNRFGTTLFGLAYKGEIRSGLGLSVSIISEQRSFSRILTATHELAHSLSADHDGENNTCLTSDRYIMANSKSLETDGTELNPWIFSKCTVHSISQHFAFLVHTSRGRMCLTGMIPRNQTYPNTGERYRYLGQKYPPDMQCEMRHGKQYSFCRDRIGQNLCTQLYCCTGDSDVAFIEPAYPGTMCGSGKLCRQGQCVPDPAVPVLNELCLFGDLEQMECKNSILNFSGFCYQDRVFNSCCSTCLSVFRQIQGCEYGDRILDCTLDICNTTNNLTEGQLCCGTCSNESAYNTSETTSEKTTVRQSITSTPTKGTTVITDEYGVRSTNARSY